MIIKKPPDVFSGKSFSATFDGGKEIYYEILEKIHEDIPLHNVLRCAFVSSFDGKILQIAFKSEFVANLFQKSFLDIFEQKIRENLHLEIKVEAIVNESLFDKTLVQEIIISGLTISLLIFGVWVYLLNYQHMEVTLARTYCMALMIIIQNIHAFNCRSEKKSIFKISFFSNPVFLVGVLGSLVLGVAVIEIDFLNVFLKTTSIPYNDLLILILLGFIIMFVMEIYKKIKYKK